MSSQSLLKMVLWSTVLLTTPVASAETLHYWRFEDSPGFLEDSIGSATLQPENVSQVVLPHDGNGADFPPAFLDSGANKFAVSTTGRRPALKAQTTPVTESFTIEVFANVRDLSLPRLRSGLSAQHEDPYVARLFSWALLVQGETQQTPGELILVVSDGSNHHGIASGIVLSENTDYFLAASFGVNDDATFYVQDLSDSGASLESVAINHSVTRLNPSSRFDLISPDPNLTLDGLIDEVRFTRGILGEAELLVNNVPEPSTGCTMAFGFLALLGLRRNFCWCPRRMND